MFVCCNCNTAFEEPIDVVDDVLDCRGVWRPMYISVSPCCEAGYEEAVQCDCCGKYVSSDNILELPNNQILCTNCCVQLKIDEF